MDTKTSEYIEVLGAESALYIATCDMRLQMLEAKYNAGQPRVPAGSPDGGQWTGDGGGGRGRGSPKYPDAIEEVHPEYLLPVARGPKVVLETILGIRAARNAWQLGGHKSPTKWANQMKDRGWSYEEIGKAVIKGKKIPAPNRLRPGNGATRFEHNGRYVVRDNVTKDILQVGGEGFIPDELPSIKRPK